MKNLYYDAPFYKLISPKAKKPNIQCDVSLLKPIADRAEELLNACEDFKREPFYGVIKELKEQAEKEIDLCEKAIEALDEKEQKEAEEENAR